MVGQLSRVLQRGRLGLSTQKDQKNSVQLHLDVKHFCNSSASALALRVLLVMVGDWL